MPDAAPSLHLEEFKLETALWTVMDAPAYPSNVETSEALRLVNMTDAIST